MDSKTQSKVQVGPDKLEVVAPFFYLGDMLSAVTYSTHVIKLPGRSPWSCMCQFSHATAPGPVTSLTRPVNGHVYISFHAECQ